MQYGYCKDCVKFVLHFFLRISARGLQFSEGKSGKSVYRPQSLETAHRLRLEGWVIP
nr:MAG TPA: PrkA serine protein kinase C-terminal domain [Caudoviricetes sp.]